MRRIETMHTGRAMKNQIPQLGWGRMFCKAMMFCGEAMGEAAPPMLEARAMPRMRALEKFESEGRLRRSGCSVDQFPISFDERSERTWIMEKQSTGEATLLIHILSTIATNMLVIKTVRGRVPALLRKNVAIIFAMWNLESAAAMVKPPSSSMMTGVHMAAKTYFVASLGSSRVCGFWSDRTT